MLLVQIPLREKKLTLAMLVAGAIPAPAKLLTVLGLGAELGTVASTGVDVVGATVGTLVGGVADAVRHTEYQNSSPRNWGVRVEIIQNQHPFCESEIASIRIAKRLSCHCF